MCFASSTNDNKKLREELIINEVVILSNEKYIFSKDYTFTSPSQADCIIIGKSSNGWKVWKDENGNTLDSLIRK